jgi:hypothetical protein
MSSGVFDTQGRQEVTSWEETGSNITGRRQEVTSWEETGSDIMGGDRK